ncbi:MAG: hypothetical protein ACYCVY_08270 [Acidiferrobacteraceae bacterium]
MRRSLWLVSRFADDGGRIGLDLVHSGSLYPYLDVICIWNIPPLTDQRWAGFVMLAAGLPLQLASVWRLLAPFSDVLP